MLEPLVRHSRVYASISLSKSPSNRATSLHVRANSAWALLAAAWAATICSRRVSRNLSQISPSSSSSFSNVTCLTAPVAASSTFTFTSSTFTSATFTSSTFTSSTSALAFLAATALAFFASTLALLAALHRLSIRRIGLHGGVVA